jgi:transketolase
MNHTGGVSGRKVLSTDAAVHAKAVDLGKLCLRMTTAAGSGHPSSALSLAHVVVQLMYRTMRYDPADPWNPGNDRLVLSEGHAVPIVYAAYADLGGSVGRSPAQRRRLTVDDLATLREQTSVLDGHPNPAEGFPFFDAATGSLGQGLSVAAGLALAARLDGIDRRIFVLIGDGESREGQVWEAADFIVDHALTNVCAVFNCNGQGQAAVVSPQQSPDALARKLRAFGWEVVDVDGHDPRALSDVFEGVGRGERPLAVVARTVKGWGVASMIGKNYHGKPLSAGELERGCAELDAQRRDVAGSSAPLPRPQPPAEVARRPAPARVELPAFDAALRRVGLAGALEKRRLATRVAYGAALVALADADARVVSLDADVSNSTYAELFAARHPDRFFECKIAEQNMLSAAVGLSAAGKIPFVSSFGKFIARATDQIDMAYISRANVKLVGSHTGVSLGADGPSQMSMADVAYFRGMTRVETGRGDSCHVFHPSDAVSAYRCCGLMAELNGLCYLRTHRPEAPFLYPLDEPFDLSGWKHVRRGDRITLAGSGYMVHTVLSAASALALRGVSCHVFDVYALPLDSSAILDAARETGGRLLVVEDNFAGGVHAELAEAAASSGGVRVEGLTVRRLPKSARTADEVFTHVGVGREQVMQAVLTMVA